jgi:hypothetical protein
MSLRLAYNSIHGIKNLTADKVYRLKVLDFNNKVDGRYSGYFNDLNRTSKTYLLSGIADTMKKVIK